MSTWNYLGIGETEPIDTDWVWERLRLQRDRLLSATDFRMVIDAPWDTQPWADYRQALRDMPENTTDPRLAVWPEIPLGGV